MLKVKFYNHHLQFNFEARTSRGSIATRQVWFVILTDTATGIFGIGEAAPLPGLSPDVLAEMEKTLNTVSGIIQNSNLSKFNDLITHHSLAAFPSIRFAYEMAFLDLHNGGSRVFFPEVFTNKSFSIPINGLIWMDSKERMLQQIDEKVAQGFTCIKIKIGGIGFQSELEILRYIRNRYATDQLTIRLDANGAFSPQAALQKIEQLQPFEIHSIEQPIKHGQRDDMKNLVAKSPIPVALDEELIGVKDFSEKLALLTQVRPPYVILKPSLLGGFKECLEWIQICAQLNIGWWLTSALESNIGLNAIAQFSAYTQAKGPQGLGTGKLYHNNIFAPLVINNGNLQYNPSMSWDLSFLLNGFSVK